MTFDAELSTLTDDRFAVEVVPNAPLGDANGPMGGSKAGWV
jgi:hypothetical protein